MALKALISSPLEAGTSLLDAHRLPPQFAPALEYTSGRLAKKGLHLTLVVARRDYQLPNNTANNNFASLSATENPLTNLPTPPASPACPAVVPCTPGFTALKSLVRSGTDLNSGSADKSNTKPPQRSMTASLPRKASLASIFDGGLGSPRLRWPLTPKTPTCIPLTPRTPATPATPASSVATSSSGTAYSSPGGPSSAPHSGIRLIYTMPLGARADKLVTSTLARAARKFNLGTSLTAHAASTYNMQPDVLHRSILQNELLFCSEGLTLLSIDHLYTFRSALAHYAAGKTEPGSDFRLEDAVDELRRCVLSSAGGRQKLLKSKLVGTFEWLGPVDEAALGDVMRMYCRAYGGMAGDTGVVDDLCKVADRNALEAKVARPIALSPPPTKSQVRTARVSADALASTPAPPLSATSQSQSPRSRTVEDFSPMADEGGADVTKKPQGNHEHMAPVEQQKKASGDDNDKTPTATRAPEQQIHPSQGNSPEALSESLPRLPVKPPTPRASPKASLPALKLQTSFHSTPKPLPKPVPRRKTTPMPPQRVSPREQRDSPPRRGGDSSRDNIEIVLHADTDADAESDKRDGADAGDVTDFEDGDVTARPPPSSAVRAFWPGGSIDEVLGDQRRRGGTSSFLRHRRSSSLGFSPLQQQQHSHEGPATPNGYEDISPITRGEWGFLMVSDPFKTKTAAVETF